MPKKTFINLSEDRRTAITNAFLREFTINKYDNASISSVLKSLGIAKGSFYQYFDNKRELFEYLTSQLYATKYKYVMSVERSKYDSFWDYARAMYEHGLVFDRDHPLMSNFGYCLMENMDSPTVRETMIEWQKQGFESIKEIVNKEIEDGNFRDDIPLESAAMFFMNMGKMLFEQLRMNNLKDFEDRVKKGRPLLAGGNEKLLFALLDQNFKLLSAALDKK